MGIYALFLGRKEDGREPFLHLLFVNCPQFKTPNAKVAYLGVGCSDALHYHDLTFDLAEGSVW